MSQIFFETVAVFKNAIEANIARSKLEAAGLHCILENDQTASLWPSQFVDIKLQVPKESLKKALEVLRSV